jgi:hypothetical protein
MLLGFFRLWLAAMPVRRIIRGVTMRSAGNPEEDVSEAALDVARRVQWAVSAVARHSAVKFVCFPQALAGYVMLRWRGIPSTIVYGVKRSQDGELMAHTWLMVGDAMVLGGDAAWEFTAMERWS